MYYHLIKITLRETDGHRSTFRSNLLVFIFGVTIHYKRAKKPKSCSPSVMLLDNLKEHMDNSCHCNVIVINIIDYKV